MTTDNRPLSPHLDIYRWRITMLLSTLHRVSGPVISFGLFILIIKLTSLAVGGTQHFSESGMIAKIFWVIWSAAVYYHLCNGIRHLFWDVGHGFEIPTAEKSAKLVLVAAVVLTVVTWLFV